MALMQLTGTPHRKGVATVRIKYDAYSTCRITWKLHECDLTRARGDRRRSTAYHERICHMRDRAATISLSSALFERICAHPISARCIICPRISQVFTQDIAILQRRGREFSFPLVPANPETAVKLTFTSCDASLDSVC